MAFNTALVPMLKRALEMCKITECIVSKLLRDIFSQNRIPAWDALLENTSLRNLKRR